MNYREQIAALLNAEIETQFGVQAQGLLEAIEIPTDPKLGDYALPCFPLAKTLRKAPPLIAAALQPHMRADFLANVEAVGGYLNFFIEPAAIADAALRGVLEAGATYGRSDEGAGKTVCLDYSSINIAKAFHIGHLMTTAIGHSINRILQFLGYTTVSINHLGDYGTQFGKLIVALRLWGDPEALQADPMGELTRVYVKFHEEAEKDPTLDDAGREVSKKIEEGDAESVAAFEEIKSMTMEDASRVYDMLDVRFDSYAGESFYNDKMERVVRELTEKGLLQESDGAQVVDLEAYKMPPCLILRRDGVSLYATRDIAAALYRADTYHFEKCLYVVAYQQDLHFRQWFKVVELMGYPWASGLAHVSYGMVSLEDGPMSTRKGRVVLLADLLQRSIEKAREKVVEQNPQLADAELNEISRQVGVGAVLFSALFNNRIKDVVFSWERALNFNGETGPYVQYTHARSCSVLRKAEAAGCAPDSAQLDASKLTDAEAQSVLKLLLEFPAAVQEAARRYEPYVVTRWLVAMAQAFNLFYNTHRILDEDAGARNARLLLTRAVRDVLASALYLIGLEAPERM